MIDKNKYVVLDVETSGLDPLFDSLLSISFYRPDNCDSYTRFLPLGRWTKITPEITAINGITEETLKDKVHITNREFQKIAERFELYSRTIIHFGKIDPNFLLEYLYRKKIKGYEKLNFFDIKQYFITNSFASGEYNKDNLCVGLGIKGVTKVHSGENDCKLEWQLFEKTNKQMLFCPHEGGYKVGIYRLTDKYYVPTSYISSYPKFKKIMNLPKLKVIYETIYSLTLSKKCNNKYDICPQPSGFACENLIRNMLNAKDVYDKSYATKNHNHLIKIGKFTFTPNYEIIPVQKNEDGTITAIHETDKKRISEINKQMANMKIEIKPVIHFIKKEIFKNKPILSQELIINNELKAFGYCDFSNDEAMLEMKFGSSFFYDENYYNQKNVAKNKYKYQFYINSNNRPSYLLVACYGKIKIIKLTFLTGEKATSNIYGKNSSIRRYVYQYSINGSYINEFRSIVSAAKTVGISEDSISRCANNKTHIGGNYRWSFKKVKQLPPIIYKKTLTYNKSCKKVFQYTKDGKFIKEFSSMTEASKATSSPVAKISMVCNGKRNFSGGYRWSFKKNNLILKRTLLNNKKF